MPPDAFHYCIVQCFRDTFFTVNISASVPSACAGATTRGILYFVTLMARLDTILHSGNDVSASSIDEISLSGIVSALHRRTPGFHKGATRIVRSGRSGKTSEKVVYAPVRVVTLAAG